MKRLFHFPVWVLLLAVTFTAQSCGKGNDMVYEDYQEYPGDLAALGFTGPVKKVWITSQSVATDIEGSFRFYLSENACLEFDADGNLACMIADEYVYSKKSTVTEKKGSYIHNYLERDNMGRVTLETFANTMSSPVATISYIYNDNDRKCKINRSANGKGTETSSVRLDKYGHYGSLFTADCMGLSRLKKAMEDTQQGKYKYTYDNETGNPTSFGYFPQDAPESNYVISFTYEYYDDYR